MVGGLTLLCSSSYKGGGPLYKPQALFAPKHMLPELLPPPSLFCPNRICHLRDRMAQGGNNMYVLLPSLHNFLPGEGGVWGVGEGGGDFSLAGSSHIALQWSTVVRYSRTPIVLQVCKFCSVRVKTFISGYCSLTLALITTLWKQFLMKEHTKSQTQYAWKLKFSQTTSWEVSEFLKNLKGNVDSVTVDTVYTPDIW